MATDTPTLSGYTAPHTRTVHRVVWVLLGSSLVLKGAGFAWDYLGYYVGSGLGYGTTAAGAALTLFGVGWCIGLATAGALTDRLGQRTALVLLMSCSSLACFALAFTESFTALLVVSLFLGMSMDVHHPAVSAEINASIDTEAGRTRAQTWLYWSSNVGIALSGGIGGFLAHRYGYSGMFVVNGLACLGFAAMAYKYLAPRRTQAPAAAPTSTYREVLADPTLRWITVTSVCGLVCAGGLLSVLPLLMTSDSLPPTSFGIAMLANTIAVLILSPPITRLLVGKGDTLKYSLVPILGSGCAILGLGIGLAALQHTTLGYAIAAALLVPGEIAFCVALGAYISIRAPRHATGRYQAVLSAAHAVASLIPLGIALALEAGGRPLVAALLVSSALIAVASCHPLAKALRNTAPPQSAPAPAAV